MKLNKTLFLAALTTAGLLAVSSANAQDSTPSGATTSTNTAPNPAPRGMRNRPDIAKILNLTDDQKARVQPILDSQREKMRAIFQDSSLSSDDRRAKLKAIRDDTAAQLKPILTPDQFEKWQKISVRGRRMAPPPGGDANAPAPATPPPAAPPAPPQQ